MPPSYLMRYAEETDGIRPARAKEHLAAEIVAGYEVTGRFILRAGRHAERITGLDNAELNTVAEGGSDLVAGADTTGALATYRFAFASAAESGGGLGPQQTVPRSKLSAVDGN